VKPEIPFNSKFRAVSPVSSFNSRLAASKKDSGNSYEGKKLSFFYPQPSPVYPQTGEAALLYPPFKVIMLAIEQ